MRSNAVSFCEVEGIEIDADESTPGLSMSILIFSAVPAKAEATSGLELESSTGGRSYEEMLVPGELTCTPEGPSSDPSSSRSDFDSIPANRLTLVMVKFVVGCPATGWPLGGGVV